MNKILSLIALSLCLVSFWFVVNSTYAAEGIKVTTTAEIPWANCEEWKKDSNGKVLTYDCTVKKGFWQITLMLGQIIKYFTFLASLWGVLFIVINGILYSMGWIDGGWKDEAKKRITKTLIGLAILLLSWVILNAIAPWIYKL